MHSFIYKLPDEMSETLTFFVEPTLCWAGHRVCSQIQTGPGSRADPVASTGLARQTFAVVGTQRQKTSARKAANYFNLHC